MIRRRKQKTNKYLTPDLSYSDDLPDRFQRKKIETMGLKLI